MAMTLKETAVALERETGLRDVAPADVRELVGRGLIRIIAPGQWPLCDLEGFTAVEELRQVGETRRAWLAASIGRWDAAEALGLCLEEFDALAARQGLQPGRFWRYRRTEVMRLRRLR